MALLGSGKSTCSNCGTKFKRNAKFCPSCGHEVPEESVAAKAVGASGQESSFKSRLRLRIGLISVAACLALGGLVTGGVLKIQHDNEVKREREAAAAEKERNDAALSEAKKAHEACVTETKDMLTLLEEVNGRLDVGMNYRDYSDLVSDLNVEYRGLDTSDMHLDCLTDVAVPAEEAVSKYVEAAREWSDCLDDLYCETDEIDLQSYWSDATVSVSEASSGLDSISPESMIEVDDSEVTSEF